MMIKKSGHTTGRHIVYCNCGGERIDPALLSAVGQHLGNVPVRVTVLSDLCGLAAMRKNELAGLFSEGEECLVIGCQLRSMNLLFGMVNNQESPLKGFSQLNLIESTVPEAIRAIDEFCGNLNGSPSKEEIAEGSGWPSWYPVIDYSRCTSCGQCADFCLFGVYGKTGGRVKVINPDACKNNCPACARICPATAIVFPKYRQGGAIGGSDEIDEKEEQQRQTHDIEEFLGNDIYHALQRRKMKRQSIIREEAMKKAISERERAQQGSSTN